MYVCTNSQPKWEYSNSTVPFLITAIERTGTGQRTHVGGYETWICAGCGYTEWYAVDEDRFLEQLAAKPGSGVRLVDAVSGTPYR